MRKRLVFLIEGLKRSTHTGSLVPGSRALAQELARHIPKDRPSRILEAGPGTGPITEGILKVAAPGSFLQLVEMNPVFCSSLKERYVEAPQKISVALFEGMLQDLPRGERFDSIVSSLPHNNLEIEDVKALFRTYRELLTPGGFLTFYEYWGVRVLRHVWLASARKRRWEQIEHFFKSEIAAVTVETRLVLSNLPPALVRSIRFS